MLLGAFSPQFTEAVESAGSRTVLCLPLLCWWSGTVGKPLGPLGPGYGEITLVPGYVLLEGPGQSVGALADLFLMAFSPLGLPPLLEPSCPTGLWATSWMGRLQPMH